ncbi:uncharacterized protein V1516DRAFT_679414 [Lipomyces oligophaga]|uniref:uncharacterized protein n=1 Tax=Lipomyces oligophaga TaxID=45792 RepID=UPI0034CF3061
MTIDALPDETLALIFGYLDPQPFLFVSQVCSRWRALTRIPYILESHIRTWLCSRPHECEYLDAILDQQSEKKQKWIEHLYVFLLRRKLIALSLVMSVRVMYNSMFRQHPHYECSTVSPDGRYYVILYRDKRVYPEPLRTVRIYDLYSDPPALVVSLILTIDTLRSARQVAVSRDVRSIAIESDFGYIQVYDLILPLRSTSEMSLIYESQFPSSVHSMAISSSSNMLALGFHRLGGLTIINLKTNQELDVPHYRLDLKMSLQAHDQALCLSGWKETIVMRSFSDDDWTERSNIWEYYRNLIESMESTYVQLENAVALYNRPFFVGIKKIQYPYSDDTPPGNSDFIAVVDLNAGIDLGSDSDSDIQEDLLYEEYQLKLICINDPSEQPSAETFSEPTASIRDGYELDEDVRASKIISFLPEPTLREPELRHQSFTISDDDSRLLTFPYGMPKVYSLSHRHYLSYMENYSPGRTEDPSLSSFDQCMNLLLGIDLHSRRAEMSCREFEIQSIRLLDAWFIGNSSIVCEYENRLEIYILTTHPELCKFKQVEIDPVGDVIPSTTLYVPDFIF